MVINCAVEINFKLAKACHIKKAKPFSLYLLQERSQIEQRYLFNGILRSSNTKLHKIQIWGRGDGNIKI
jgi:hypothetical protein